MELHPALFEALVSGVFCYNVRVLCEQAAPNVCLSMHIDVTAQPLFLDTSRETLPHFALSVASPLRMRGAWLLEIAFCHAPHSCWVRSPWRR